MSFGPDQRIVFVTGKGGVGKTSVAAALSRLEAERRGNATLLEFEGSLAALRALGSERDGIRHLVLNYSEALTELVAALTDSRLLGQLVVGQRSLRRLLAAIPAIRELAALERIRRLAGERPHTRVVVDLPATGHGIDWLRVPSAAQRFLRIGPLSEVCQRLVAEVVSVERSAVVVVSSVEPVVAAETRQLCRRLREELGRSPTLVVANRVPRRPEPDHLVRLGVLAHGDLRWQRLAAIVAEDLERARQADDALETLAGIVGAPLVTVPELFADPAPSDLVPYLGYAP